MGDENKLLLHVLFLPYFASGHLIPLVNAARLFAARGVKVTILTTPHNALLFQSSINDDVLTSGHPISVHTLKFPSAEVGLPEGIESFSASTSPEMPPKIFYAILLLQQPMKEQIRIINPDCIFSDVYFPWTVDIAEELKIPRILFNQSSYMYNSIRHNLKLHKPYEHFKSESQIISVPDLPDKIEFKISQLEDYLWSPTHQRDAYDELLDQIRESDDRSYGIVHDTFYELEPAYAEYYSKIKKTKCWHIGSISHFASQIRRMELVGDQSGDGVSSTVLLEWLKDKKPASVLYVSFGSTVRFPEDQLTEIAKALEASCVSFIWVVRKSQLETTWLPPTGFEERATKNRKGIIVRGWAPQVTILENPAIGGFITHCGWNSVLESVTAGVPMLTWPLFAEQFYNEKLVEVLGLGIKMGTEIRNHDIEIISPIIGSEQIRRAIEELMISGSVKSEQIREKAKVMGNMARIAVEEGGSSWNNINALIEDIKNFKYS